jgi:thioester reductase-like protein
MACGGKNSFSSFSISPGNRSMGKRCLPFLSFALLHQNVLQTISRSASFVPITIQRVGQISGHFESGSWNVTDAYPRLLLSGVETKSMPDFPRAIVDWLPSDVVAGTIKSSLTSNTPLAPFRVLNITHPHSISWSDFLSTLSNVPSFPSNFKVLPYEQWINEVASKDEGGIGGLADFFGDLGKAGLPEFVAAEEVTEALKSVKKEQEPTISPDEIARWLAFWQKK